MQTRYRPQAMVGESIRDGLPVNLHAVRDNFCRQAVSLHVPSSPHADTFGVNRHWYCSAAEITAWTLCNSAKVCRSCAYNLEHAAKSSISLARVAVELPVTHTFCHLGVLYLRTLELHADLRTSLLRVVWSPIGERGGPFTVCPASTENRKLAKSW